MTDNKDRKAHNQDLKHMTDRISTEVSLLMEEAVENGKPSTYGIDLAYVLLNVGMAFTYSIAPSSLQAMYMIDAIALSIKKIHANDEEEGEDDDN